MAKKKPHQMTPEEFYEYEQMEEILHKKKEYELDQLAQKRKQLADEKKNEWFFGKPSSPEIDNKIADLAAVKTTEYGYDIYGRKIFDTEKGVFQGLGRTWVPVVGMNGEPMDSVENLYRHYDFNLPSGVVEGMDFIGIGEFYRNLRNNFMEQYACFLNTMVSKATYAEFKKKSYVTVCRWTRERRLDVVEIDGVGFILIPLKEMNEFDEFLMQRTLSGTSSDDESRRNRERTMIVWEKKHGSERKITDSVVDWIEFEGMCNIPFNKRERISSDDAYFIYKKYCEEVITRPLETKRLFMERIKNLGYVRCGGKNRGFYWYPIDRLEVVDVADVAVNSINTLEENADE
jgi:hypothetical protein